MGKIYDWNGVLVDFQYAKNKALIIILVIIGAIIIAIINRKF